MINVRDFCFRCTEPRMTIAYIYDMNPNRENHVVYEGTMYDAAMSAWKNCEVCSFDHTEVGIVMNVDTSDT